MHSSVVSLTYIVHYNVQRWLVPGSVSSSLPCEFLENKGHILFVYPFNVQYRVSLNWMRETGTCKKSK